MKEILLAFFGSLSLAITFNVGRNRFVWAGLSGAVGWIAYSWLYEITGQVIVSTFVGAVCVGLYSEIAARCLKCPATVFSISGIFPLVPGIGAYQTVEYIVGNELAQSASKGIETLASAGCIALGIMLMSAVFRVMKNVKKGRKTP
ncbi:threonine/serine exporter family protein [Pseudoclostridium thermosuccinogenes]|uniref:threonine/serine exporter family protein n=1 Tax=Clostridium thermosuccinogenes TaxID=84032 RepID=UPI000CCC859C|nr:threonine/serine exporter family protein [Pseudoclostridium thermosuccinogenes]PNT92489.1 hypothetical protein CDQ83_02660 [Pseudoclostridium thermosuccinogenes]